MNRQASTKFITLLLGTAIFISLGLAEASQKFRDRITTDRIADVTEIEADTEAEISLGREIAARILGKYELSDNRSLNRYITLVGRSIALNSNRPELPFHFALINTDEINAYTTPGGYVFLTRGALELMEDEAELAAVLAHEIAHATQKHIVKELDIKASEEGAEAGLLHFLGGVSDPTRVAFTQAVDQAVSLLFEEGLKKEDEFEADLVGTMLATSTGYEPTALHRYLSRVKNIKGEKTAILSHTHPSFSDRLKALRTLHNEEGLASSDGPTVQKRFAKNIRK